MSMSSPLRLAVVLAAAGACAVAAPSAHALPRQNVCGPGWYGDYSNEVSIAGYFNDQAAYYWNQMDVLSGASLDYAYEQYNSAIYNRDSHQRRADQLLRSCR
jgi:hypothetical protein